MTKEEFTKMKQELEAWVNRLQLWLLVHCLLHDFIINNMKLCCSEYLAIFKKTVAMHEVFLCRVAAHPVLRKDLNFHVFLEYNQDVSVPLLF